MQRYVLQAAKLIVEKEFKVQADSEVLYEPNYNVISGATMPIIVQEGDNRKILPSTWGLQHPDLQEKVSEITQEECLDNDCYLELAEKSPCIIPASGFYAWKETVNDPLPFYLRLIPKDVMGFAGICYSYAEKDGRTVHSFALLTMPANPLVEPLDDRMPVILDSKDYEPWLQGNAPQMIKNGFSGTHLLPDMSVYRVSELVNDPANNAKELIQPIPKLRNYEEE
jgi:putative SOS response-associated peptidase YedK